MSHVQESFSCLQKSDLGKPLISNLEFSVLEEIEKIIEEEVVDLKQQKRIKDIWHECKDLVEVKSELAKMGIYDAQKLINRIRLKLKKPPIKH